MIDIDDALAPRCANHIPQQHLAVVDRTAPEVVAIEVQEVKREISKPLRVTPGDGLAQGVEMGDAAVIGNGDLAIQNHGRQPGLDEPPKGLPE